MKWVKRIVLGILGLIAVAVALGSGYEALARNRVAKEFPPAGTLVDVGGRRLEIDCRGSGTPTVVLEAGLEMNGPLSWSLVHDSIAQTTRTCGYSRAGLMWSDPTPAVQNAVTIAADLKKLLDAAHEPGPYVMVGHSLGGPYIMTFTKQFPNDVAGLVFVDASHPDQVRRFKEVIKNDSEQSSTIFKVAAALRWTGLVRLAAPDIGDPKLPKEVQRAMAGYAPTSLPAMLAESDGLDATLAEAGTLRQLGDRPLVVLTAMAPIDSGTLKTMKMTKEDGDKFQDVWKSLHDEEAAWSSRSEHVLVPDAKHYIQIDRPDVVIAAVRKVVTMVRTPASDSTSPAPR